MATLPERQEQGLWPHLKVAFDMPPPPKSPMTLSPVISPKSISPTGFSRPSLSRPSSLPDLWPVTPQGHNMMLKPLALDSPNRRKASDANLAWGCSDSGDSTDLVWERSVMHELRAYKGHSTSHPLFQQMDSKFTRQALLQADASGEVAAARSMLRKAKHQLGPEHPLVKSTGAWLSEVEHCSRECRENLAACTLQTVPMAMSMIGRSLTRLVQSKHEMGRSIWDDPWLRRAREKHEAWGMHKQAFLGFGKKSLEGPDAYCAAWAELSMSSSEVRCWFGPVITNELSKLPGMGVRLAHALADPELEQRMDDAPEDLLQRVLAKIARISNLLGALSNRQLDQLLLSEGLDGRSATKVAAEFWDSTIFCSFLNVLASEVLAIDQGLQQQLEQNDPDDATAQVPSIKRVVTRLGQAFSVDASTICAWEAPDGGIQLRLFPLLGQPSAEQATEMLGGKAVAEPWHRGARCVRVFQVKLKPSRLLAEEIFDALSILPRARESARQARAAAEEATATSRAADEQAIAAERYAEESVVVRAAADQVVVDARKHVVETDREASKLAMSLEDNVDDKVEAAEKAYDAAKKARKRAEDDAVAVARREVESAEAREAAKIVAAQAEAQRASDEANAVKLESHASGLFERLEELLSKPLALVGGEGVSPKAEAELDQSLR
mmetsp:Transcript_131636/g.421111  ORF Transcript_131636/g.421111 Transcript_131636/m.421111 type:complete len:668 (-) Transcript_131636:555-2558(-)